MAAEGGAREPQWHTLPPDVSLTLFRMLSAQDRMRAACVCSAWRDACHDPDVWTRVALAPMPDATCAQRAALLLAATQRAAGRLEELDARPWCLDSDSDDDDEGEADASLENLVRTVAGANPRLCVISVNARAKDVESPVWALARYRNSDGRCVFWPRGRGVYDGERIYAHLGADHPKLIKSKSMRPEAIARLIALVPPGRKPVLRCDAAVFTTADVVQVLHLSQGDGALVAVETLCVRLPLVLPTHDLHAPHLDAEQCVDDSLPALLSAPGVQRQLKHLFIQTFDHRSFHRFREGSGVDDDDPAPVEATFAAALAAPLLTSLRLCTRDDGEKCMEALKAAVNAAAGPLRCLRHVTLSLEGPAMVLDALHACLAVVEALRTKAPNMKHLFFDVCLEGGMNTLVQKRDAALGLLRAALAPNDFPQLSHLQLCVEICGYTRNDAASFLTAFAAEVDALAQLRPHVRVRFAAHGIPKEPRGRYRMTGRMSTGGKAPRR